MQFLQATGRRETTYLNISEL
uniref:DNA excision repair protein ERCC-1 n=1 Tax=Rhizophora mucronata TaxID=61149 RepID=A0A2P2R1H3_RHIMU